MAVVELHGLADSHQRWQSGEIDAACYAGLYFLHWQAASHGQRFASRRHRQDPKPDPKAWLGEANSLGGQALGEYLRVYFDRYQFFGIINNVPAALSAWLRGEWALALCEHIPQPLEVLAMQVRGVRPVTVISRWPRLLEPVLEKPNAFAFMVHDLEHAWKFFHDGQMHEQQRQFFAVLAAALGRGVFDEYLQDAVFVAKFHYLISDMNTHSLHATQFLRAILVEYHLRRESQSHPDGLTAKAKEAVARLLRHLLGAEWLALIESRMLKA